MLLATQNLHNKQRRNKRQQLSFEAEKLAHIGSFEWDIRTNRVTWSDGLYEIFGLNPQEFGASFEAFLDHIHPGSRQMVRKTIETSFQSDQPFEMEEWIVRPGGEVRVLFSKGECIKNKQGKPIRLIGVCQDITERKQARESELRQKLLEAENARKTKELKEARKLQLSMLPKVIPTLPDLDIAVYMKTATEVGGDYYDFQQTGDGELTLAIGDATGHGLQAGMMVIATKSLFRAFAGIPQPVTILREISKVLKSMMGLRNLYMALTIAKYKAKELRLSAAGMPYVLLYHAASQQVEEIVLKGMPLGKFPDFPYQEYEIRLKPGDAVLFMSDGLIDRFNPSGERLGEEPIKTGLNYFGQYPPAEIIKALLKTGEMWAQGRAAHDDMTFVVLQAK